MNTISVDPTASFDAAIFFSELRSIGLHPHIFNGRLVFDVPNLSRERHRELFDWAARNDTGGSMQSEYARERWNARGNSVLVHLG